MSNRKSNHLNFMEEMRQMIWEIDELKPEPEMCNVSCPPFGCPLGPCPGMYGTKTGYDPCCVSKMPKSSPPSMNPARSYPSRSCPPLANQITSYSLTYLHPSHSEQHAAPTNDVSTFKRTREITSPQISSSFKDQHGVHQYSSISVCQVPSSNPRSHINNDQAQYTQQNLNPNMAHQSQSSTIEVCYPSICPQTFVAPSVMSSTRNGRHTHSPSCPPPYNRPQFNHEPLNRDSSQFSEYQQQASSQQLCPPNSPCMVTIPLR